MRFTTARAGSILCLLLGCGLAALPARAAADQAREAVGLFAQSCLKHVEDPADLQAWIAATPQLRQFPPEEDAVFLEGKRGDVWSAEKDAGAVELEIGRESGRERGCQYVRISGVTVTLKTTHYHKHRC